MSNEMKTIVIPESVEKYGSNLTELDGIKVFLTGRKIAWRADCSYCILHAPGSMMPSHTASEMCQSGKHNHCTCDTCF